MPKTFQAGNFLKNELGVTILGTNPNGNVRVRDQSGAEREFDLHGYLQKEVGIDPKKVSVELNNQDSPFEETPLTAVDRAKISLGNTSGSLNYLKNKFQDAKINGNSDIVVKDKGAWKKVDPSWFSGHDAWDVTKEIGRDIADWAGDTLPIGGSIGGAVGGTAAAGPVGGVAGSAAGGASGEALRTSLGRLAGTYEATPQEQLKDVGIEGLLGAGGQLLGLGARPTLSMLRKAGTTIATKAAPATKDILSKALGATTGAGEPAIRTLIDNSDAVVGKIASLRTQAGAGATADSLENIGKTEAIIKTKNFLQSAVEALPERYGQGLDQLFKNPKSAKVSIDPSELVMGARDAIQKAGFGTFDKAGNFRALNPKELAARVNEAGGAPMELSVDEETTKAIGKFVKGLDAFSDIGTLKGPKAAQLVTTMNKSLNQVVRDAYKGKTSPATARAMAVISDNFRNQLSTVMDKAGLSGDWTMLNKLYSDNVATVNNARKILRQQNGSELLLNRLASNSGMNLTPKNEAKQLADVIGPNGLQQFRDIMITDSARRLSSWMPKFGLFQNTGTGISAGVLITGHPAAAAAGASTMSPMLVAKQVQYGNKVLDFIKRLSPGARQQWLANPETVNAVFQEGMKGAGEEEQIKNQLLQSKGIRP